LSKFDDLLTRSIFGFVRRVPGWVVTVVALVFYPGAGLLLPLWLQWPFWGLIEANVLGTLCAAVLAIGYLAIQIEAKDRRHLVEWTTNLRLLNAEEFEWLVGELFRREGWEVRETGRQDGPDGNIDLELTGQQGRRIVQCKRWDSWEVGVDEVRKFAGTLMREALPGNAGIFVTLSHFTNQTSAEAQKIGLALIDGNDLYHRVEKARRTEPCSKCGAPMALRHSQYGWYFRCAVEGCDGKRHLDDKAGRAVEILTLAA
jgi:hypothetical protein